MVPLFAAAIEKLDKVPANFWMNLAIILGIIVAVIFVVKNALKMNKIILFIIVSVVCGIVGFQWIYERNEPEFMTPFIEPLTQFFPSKESYDEKQQQDATKPGVKKNTTATPKPVKR